MCEIIKIGSKYNSRGKKINTYKIILNESHKYTGNHPLEFRDHYEHLLEEKGIIEIDITDINIKKEKLIITYTEQ